MDWWLILHEISLDLPTKLYFDIEFDVKNNHEKNSKSVINKIIDIFLDSSKKKFGIDCCSDDVIVLDSSNHVKVSFHLIFKTVIFDNNKTCKDFVNLVLENLSTEDLVLLSAFDSKSKSKLIIDLSVYNKNQNFRLILSSKFGKNSPLTLVDKNLNDVNVFNKQIFLDTLICDQDLVVNTFDQTKTPDNNELFSESCMPTVKPHVPSYEKNNLINKVSSKYPSIDNVSSKYPSIDKVSSKYPLIDNIVRSQIGSGKIRKIKMYENKETTNKPILIYEIAGYHFCDNVKRNHRSNNIYFIADVCRMCIYQKCHDPVCEGFRGQDIFI